MDELFNAYSLGAAVSDGRMLAAFRDGMLVGLLEFDRVDAARTMVWKLYVDPDAQGRGIGGLLLERLLQAARTPEVRVEHDERNARRGGFFAGFGFAVDEVVDAGDGARTVRRVRRLSREVLLDDRAQAGVDDVGPVAEGRAVAEPLEQVEAPVRRAARRPRARAPAASGRRARTRSRGSAPRSRAGGRRRVVVQARLPLRREHPPVAVLRSPGRRAAGSAPTARRRRAPRRGSRASRSGRSRSRRAARRRRDAARSRPPPTRG